MTPVLVDFGLNHNSFHHLEEGPFFRPDVFFFKRHHKQVPLRNVQTLSEGFNGFVTRHALSLLNVTEGRHREIASLRKLLLLDLLLLPNLGNGFA